MIIGVVILGLSMVKDNDYKKEDKRELDNFFNEYNEVKEEKSEEKNSMTNISYSAVIEVPAISLKAGIVMSDKSFKSMDRNVSIYPSSNMPDEKHGNFVLFAHSGNSRVSYFRNIDKLNKDDEIKIYYNKTEYKYKVISKHEVNENDDTPLYKMKDKTIITLITCNNTNDNYRTVVVGEAV